MSNLNVEALKRLFPKNTARGRGGKVNGANRKRVQVMLPPETLARLDELIEHDEQARSAAVALAVEYLCASSETDNTDIVALAANHLMAVIDPRPFLRFIAWLMMADDRNLQP